MIGNVIQSLYLEQRNYPEAAALSFLMMAAILVVVLIYLRLAGTGAFMGEEDERTRWRQPATAARPRVGARAWAWLRRNALLIYAGLAVAYMLVPILVIALFSFERDAQGELDFTFDGGFTLEYWKDAFAVAESTTR